MVVHKEIPVPPALQDREINNHRVYSASVRQATVIGFIHRFVGNKTGQLYKAGRLPPVQSAPKPAPEPQPSQVQELLIEICASLRSVGAFREQAGHQQECVKAWNEDVGKPSSVMYFPMSPFEETTNAGIGLVLQLTRLFACCCCCCCCCCCLRVSLCV